LTPEPRLRRRPSLIEIREARERVIGRPSPGADLSQTEITVQRSVSDNTWQQEATTRQHSSTATLPASSSSSSSLSALVSRSAPPGNNTPMAPRRRAVPLPPRLTEGHLLLPPGKRLLNAVIQVRETEPTSWIAHALCSDEYASKLAPFLGPYGNDWERVLTSFSRLSFSGAVDEQQEEAMQINCGFTDASEYSARQCAFSVRSFYAPQFHALRMLYAKKGAPELDERLLERRFIESLSRCNAWKPTGGKSQATFLKTLDDRFIVKSVSQEEFEMFQELAPKYFAHLANVLGPISAPSVLVPFLGLFAVTMQSEVVIGMRRHRGQQENIHKKLLVVVSPNIFWKRDPKVTYDLKGNLRNRLMRNPEEGAVRLDANFFQEQRGVPLPLHPQAKETLASAVSNDAAFLASAGVVDYSLLVGVHEDSITAGIIDYLQLYNYKKMFESTVKKAAGQAEPTVVSPRKYQARFVSSMDRYFLSSGHPLLAPRPVAEVDESELVELIDLDTVE
jgi:1-phosphatidylinositol-3-phosphate 5-kinase